MGLSSKQVSTDHLEFNWTQNLLASNNIQQTSNQRATPMKRSLQSQSPDPIKCPRCESTNTKFCYYNNYNKTQPRHYCKACKRHWTKGGTLRNVPVGGGRKNKRVKRAAAATTNAAAAVNQGVAALSDQKYMFPEDHHKGLFFKPTDHGEFDQVSWDFNNFPNSSTTMHQNLGFSTQSNMTFADTITNPNPNPITQTSFSQLLSSFKDDSISTLTTTRMLMPNSSTVSSQPWLQIPTTSSFLEPNYWNWNDTDSMVLQTDQTKPFTDDDPQMN